jgi:hypothetical protein
LDLRAEYDKYVQYKFYGLGPDSVKDDETVASYLKEELGVTFGHGFSPALVLEGAYVLRRYRTFNVAPDRPFTELLQGEGTKFSPYLSLIFRYDTSNSQIHPTRGFRFLIQNDFAGRAVGNKVGKYYRMTLDLRSYTQLFFPKAVLAVRALVQKISGSNIPLWELSTLGGGSTASAMRGYALNRFMDNGKFLSFAEYRFSIWKRIGGNIFAEGGLVWPSWSAIALKKAVLDAGGGLRYYLKNFVARFDMGFSREGTGIYFNFGHLVLGLSQTPQDGFERLRHGGLDFQSFAAGQVELDLLGVKHQSRKLFLRRTVPVLQVADDRMPEAVEMDPDLVAPAGKRVGPDEGVPLEPLVHLEFRRRRLAEFHVHPHPPRPERPDGLVDDAAVALHEPVGQGQVGLSDGTAVELTVQVAVHPGVFGENDDPARLPVEAVDGVKLPGVDIVQQFGKTAFPCLGDGNDSLRLVDGQNAVVFEEDTDRGNGHFF